MGLSLDSGRQLQTSLESFAEKTGIHADLMPALGSSAEQVTQTLRLLNQHAGTPDVYVIDVVYPGTLSEHLLDLTPYVDADAHAHLPELLQNDTVHGHLVSLPFYVNVGMLYYRTDLLEKYHYPHPPNTWSELESMAAKLQQGEREAGNPAFWGYVWQGRAYEGLTCNALEWQVSFGGGRIVESNGVISVNNRAAIQALEAGSRWRDKISPPSVLSYTESDSLHIFSAGNAAFLRHWSGGFPPARARDSAVAGRFSMAALPAGPHGRAQALGGFHLAVSRYSKHPREAAELVRYLTGSEVQLQRALSGGYLPSIPSLYRNPELLRVLPFVKELQNPAAPAWIARPSTVTGDKYKEVSKAYYTAVSDVLNRKTRPESALARLEKQLVELTGLPTGPPVP
jgi:trehalose/maltose transport system substrate-binding protein